MRMNSLATATILALVTVSTAWTTSNARTLVPAGTTLNVRLDSKISTEDARQGDSWSGTVSQSVIARNRVMIPAGSPVVGVVTSAAQGTHNSRPQLGLGVRQVVVNGRRYYVDAEAQPIVAGTKRAKKIGAIVGGAAVGALAGRAIAKDKHGTLIGGILGGAAGYGLTRHALRTLQLKSGTVVSFTMSEDLVARR